MNQKKKSDITAKITTLIIAIFLWSFVMGKENPERTETFRNVPVNLSNVSALERQDLVIMSPQDVTVNIKVTGKKSELDKFSKVSSSKLTAQVDLRGYGEGQVKIPVSASIIDQSGGITISGIEPKEILFTFDKVVTEKMPVTVRTTGKLPENYVLGDTIRKTESVLISGPRTWINEVKEVVAEVGLANRTSTTTETLAISILDDEGNVVRGITKEPNVVDIIIPIYRTNSLPIELQTVGELPDNYSIRDIQITPSNIAIRGNDNVANLKKIDTKPIDINTLLDKSAMEVELNLPAGVELLNPDERVTIIYNIEETITKEFTFLLGDLNILNLDRKLEIPEDDLNQLVKVTLKGYKSVLEPIKNEDLEASIDLLDLTTGSHQVDVVIKEIEGVTVENINPQPLTINLEYQ
jgi:YbbR domain-containing protein